MKYPKHRKSPKRHCVKAHTRKGKPVRSYIRGKGTIISTSKIKIAYPRRVEGKEWLNSLVNAFYTIKEAPYYHSHSVLSTGEVLIPTFDKWERTYGKNLAEVNRDITILHELVHLKVALVINPREKDYHGKTFQRVLKIVLQEYVRQRKPPLTKAEKDEVRKHLQFYLEEKM